MPISRHPETLTKNVPNGNAEGKLFCKKRDVRNLEILPRNPPEPTSNNVLNIQVLNTLTFTRCKTQSNTKILITLMRFVNY